MRKLEIGFVLGLILLGLTSCDSAAPSSPQNHLGDISFLQTENETSILGPKADSCANFPGQHFDEIWVCKIDSNYTYAPENWIIGNPNGLPREFKRIQKPLIPAHNADLKVAINLSPRHAYMTGLACHMPDFAFLYQAKGKPVAVITLSTQCGTVHFEPPSPNRMSLNGFCRLLTVLEELGL